jgi:hypothetical protein
MEICFGEEGKEWLKGISEGAWWGPTPPWRAMVGGGPHQAPLTYPFSPLFILPPETNHHSFLSRVLAPKPEIFYIFARSFIFETVLEDCYLVCDSSIGPISFSSSGLYFDYLAILGAAVDELAC